MYRDSENSGIVTSEKLHVFQIWCHISRLICDNLFMKLAEVPYSYRRFYSPWVKESLI